MKLGPSNDLDFTFDLAFVRALDADLEDLGDENFKELLTGHMIWEKYLSHWINIIRKDVKELCPEVVRRTSSLSMGLQFTNDITISEINNLWRNVNKSTDVLSFPILDKDIILPELECVELGDIIVSVTTAKRQAQQMNHCLAFELSWLVTHGLLHLLGWDHPTSSDLEKMLNFQQQLIDNKPDLDNLIIKDHTNIPSAI